MSWTSVIPYFRSKCDAAGLAEWKDAFNFENIPSDILDGSYHIEFGEISGEALNQNDLESLVRVTIRIFRKGYADPMTARDDAISAMQTLVTNILNPQSRLTQSFKNVIFISSLVRGLAESNDNAVVTEVSFDVRSVICTLS